MIWVELLVRFKSEDQDRDHADEDDDSESLEQITIQPLDHGAS